MQADGTLSFYQYDANGERTYKLTGKNSQQGINGNGHSYASFNKATLYASPYMVCTPQGYTKHYYADEVRVASKVGSGGLADIVTDIQNWDEPHFSRIFIPDECKWTEDPTTHFSDKRDELTTYYQLTAGCMGPSPNLCQEQLRELYDTWKNNNGPEQDCYWYHPDHLGSSSWITYSDGEAVQHLHYLPWGKDFVDQRTTNWAARFTFSAKEKDAESGLSYFGSRYYSSDLSLWLSVDPMSDKYPSLSPYVYCADNPVWCVKQENF